MSRIESSTESSLDEAPTPHVAVLSHAQCLEFLESHTIGRVAWQAADGPQIVPVTYAMHQDNAYFRTSPHGILAQLVDPSDVALEVDDLDPDTRTGWSVVIRGKATAVAAPHEVAKLWTLDDLVPWAPGVRNLFIRVRPHQITGRIVTRDI